ncbi:MAG TPA: ATP-dependent DNA ligase [Longimicrobiales bacterium]
MKLARLVSASAAVAATSKRLEKIGILADLLREADADEVAVAVGFLIGWPRQGRVGAGWAAVRDASTQPAAPSPTLELADVDQAFTDIASARGKQKAHVLSELFARATADEQQFLGALVLGEVRQGALEGVVLEAVARAAGVGAADVRRASMMAGDLAAVAGRLRGPEGAASLASYRLQLFRPVQPMLADSAPTVEEAMAECDGEATVEWKLDGARIQVHAGDGRVAIYTRNLNDVTERLPEVTEAMTSLGLTARGVILDGEVIALAEGGRPREFQDTMSRFGRKLDHDTLRATMPLTPFFFDVLHDAGDDVIDEPLSERLARLDGLVPAAMRVPRLVTSDAGEAASFQADALARGHEGVMIKAMQAPYAAGRRGSAWIKVKTPRTLDLVILAAEWGSGRRQGWLSNLHLGARDPASGGFVMLGKTFKGLTDELLDWQTRELLAREERRDGHVVYVRPELVAEIAFNEVQRSSQYPGGVALRFARVKGYRPDKSASDADTIDAVRAFLPG